MSAVACVVLRCLPEKERFDGVIFILDFFSGYDITVILK